jgi:hypothetical protein
MKRRGSLLVTSHDNASITLRFYSDGDESFEPEALCDREVRDIEELGDLLLGLGFVGVPEFLQRVGSPPEVFDFLDVRLTKAELRRYGLLSLDPSIPRPFALRPEPEAEEAGE